MNPGATEIPGNGTDEDCDGVDDLDTDGDGTPDAFDCSPEDATVHAADEDGDGYSTCGLDCDDNAADVNPGATEACDGRDNDCNGLDDAGNAGVDEQETDNDGDGQWECQGACDDSDALNFPANPEACDGQDNDCDSTTEAAGGEVDADADGSLSCADCDDADGANIPGGTEVCDGQDNDCDTTTEAAGGEVDGDSDGSFSCVDCDDADGANAPGGAELCDGQDNDCDSTTEAAGGEADGDGDGSLSCADCDDADPANAPGGSEVCDGQDNDCNSLLDADAAGEVDGDADGSLSCADCDDGDASSTIVSADADCDGTLTAEDCDDSDPNSTIVANDLDCDGVEDCLSTTTAQGQDFVLVCAGTFERGCTAGQNMCGFGETPTATVALTRAFWMSETEVTRGQWDALMTPRSWSPSSCGSPPVSSSEDCPAGAMNWFDALAFANALSTAEGLASCYTVVSGSVTVNSATGSVYDCEGYRLPTEAEWEYVARAGTDLLYAGSNSALDVAWVPSTSNSTLHPVATKDPNAWGLYDMSGNLAEWTWDPYLFNYYGTDPTDPEGPTGTWSSSCTTETDPDPCSRVIRGGSYSRPDSWARVANRHADPPPSLRTTTSGFRLARTIP